MITWVYFEFGMLEELKDDFGVLDKLKDEFYILDVKRYSG